MPPVDAARAGASSTEPARGGAVITPADGTTLSPMARSIWVGGAGNINITGADGEDVLISGVAAGTLIPIRAKKIKSTSTTATLIVALY